MNNPNGKRSLGRWLVAPAMVGALVGGFGIAAAQTGSTSTTSTPTAADSSASTDSTATAAPSTADATTTTVAPTQSGSSSDTSGPSSDSGADDGGRRGGAGETALTGDTAEKVKAAALKAVPGATVDRVESDSDGSPYEAHMTKADGTHVIVKVNQAFEVTAVETEPAGGGHGGHGPGGNGETPLTGDTADKVKAAALKAVPDATVDRVETDSDGSPYEAHMTKSDGSHVTAKVNENFEVTSLQNDPAGRPRG